jgi:hypothetical protein
MDLRLSNKVEEVILVSRDDRNRRVARTVFRRKKKAKQGTAGVSSIGRLIRRIVSGGETAARVYLDRHASSNRDKADGWVRDFTYNVYRAGYRGSRKISRSTGLPTLDVD